MRRFISKDHRGGLILEVKFNSLFGELEGDAANVLQDFGFGSVSSAERSISNLPH